MKAIMELPNNDPDYVRKVKEIEGRAKQAKYKSMKSLNTQNEMIPQRVKEAMVRRGSHQNAPPNK